RTTSSCCSGKTSRNQPIQPATHSTAPRALTDILVRSPANTRVNPKARTSGHGVDAGTWISRGARELCSDCSSSRTVAISSPSRFWSSAANDVNDGENDDPHDIHEMPVHRKHFHTTRLMRADTTGQTEEQHDAQHDQTRADVKSVQP